LGWNRIAHERMVAMATESWEVRRFAVYLCRKSIPKWERSGPLWLTQSVGRSWTVGRELPMLAGASISGSRGYPTVGRCRTGRSALSLVSSEGHRDERRFGDLIGSWCGTQLDWIGPDVLSSPLALEVDESPSS
jgi:hypothetical protein